MKKKIRWISALLTALLGIFVLLFIIRSTSDDIPDDTLTVQDSVPAPTLLYNLEVDSFKVIQSTIKKNEFLANLLLPYNVNYVRIDELAKKSKEIFDVRRMAVGKPYTLLISKDSVPTARYFIYEPNEIEYIIYDLRDSVIISKGEKEVVVEQRQIAGIINSSLYQTLQEKGGSPYLAVKLSTIYAWSIDFYRIQKGDWFKVIFEEKFVDGKSIGIGKIEAAEFNHFDRSFYAFNFSHNGNSEYYDEEANSLRKAFLKSPLKFSRLSSRFTMRRFHPVQKRWKAHLGTDYAAPSGTPIMATGDGVIIKSAYGRGNGNYVKIRHNSVYETQYLHMSKRKARVGQQIRQGDIIGYVGSTGLATGPHVCYRFWKNGKQVDHLRQDFPSAEPISPELKDEFILMRDSLNTRLNSIKINNENAKS